MICLYLNARSIVNNRRDLDIMIADIEPDIIGIVVSEKCGIAASKGIKILRLIRRNITLWRKS